MNNTSEMKDSEIKEKLMKAIHKLYEDDKYLIQKKAHERSITHMLAIHLKSHFSNHDIDCEYDLDIENNTGKKQITMLKNKLKEFKSGIYKQTLNNLNEFGDIIVPVNFYPDIIIHRRGSNDLNTLIVELKKSTNTNEKSIEFDRLKLKAYTKQGLKYRLGAYVNLSVSDGFEKDKTEITFYKKGKEQKIKFLD